MKKHPESHLDHGLNEQQIAYIFDLFKDQNEFFKTTIELPPELGTVPCALWGPAMGDEPIVEGAFSFELPPGEYIIPDGLVGLADHQGVDGTRRLRWTLPSFTGAITYGTRGPRTYLSRLIDAPMRMTNKVFVVAGPHEEHACILYTCYGGPEAPQEPTDPNLPDGKRAMSEAFWKIHALSRYAK